MDHFKKELCIFFQLPSIIFQGLFLMFVLGGVESGNDASIRFTWKCFPKGPTAESARLWLDHLRDHLHYSTRTKAHKNLPKLTLDLGCYKLLIDKLLALTHIVRSFRGFGPLRVVGDR